MTKRSAVPLPLLITGTAGFIGYHLAERFLSDGNPVAGVDSLTDYYNISLKRDRLARLQRHKHFTPHRIDVADSLAMETLFADLEPKTVIHLAAQAGVSHSITHPYDYAHANLNGFMTVLECCRQSAVAHLVYASTSSVYGLRTDFPLSEHRGADHPVSLYAATKRSNELMAHAYAHLYGLPATGLRFFTVYGPWGRPDMAYYIFTRAILSGEPIQVFNAGDMMRDYTYVDDIVESITRLATQVPQQTAGFDSTKPDPSESSAPWRIYNIGNNAPINLNDMIAVLEDVLGKKAIREDKGMQPGDVVATHADVSDIAAATGFMPETDLRDGLARFADWYREYHG